jgi:predicted enzyme related to lactoylglutathione lyase
VLFTPNEARVGESFNGALACDNVERTYGELTAHGVEFVAAPEKQPWGTFAVFKDPDGNQFVLSSK